MPGGERACSAFTVNPGDAVVHNFLAGDIVTDEVYEFSCGAWNDFLKRFQNQSIDQHVVGCGKIGTKGHVVEVCVRFDCSQRSVHEFSVKAGQWNVPPGEFRLQGFELTVGQVVPDASRTTM